MRRFLGLVAVVLTGVACSGGTQPAAAPVLEVLAVRAAAVTPGSPLVVSLDVGVGGCTTFGRFEATRTAAGLELTARGRVAPAPAGAACLDVLRVETHDYVVDPPIAPGFTVVVHEPDGSRLTHGIEAR